MQKKRLFTPGPASVPVETLMESARPMVHHRKKVFKDIYAETLEKLKEVFQTSGEIFIFSSSGTGAMEAALLNLTSPGDKAIVINSGKFGARWESLSETFGVEYISLKYKWGESASHEDIRKILQENNDIKAVFATLTETSTGALHPIKDIASVVSKTSAILIVDAVSGLAADRLMMDEWGIDVVVSGSQKALMSPPGLGFVAVNERAAEAFKRNSRKNYYWDLKKASKSAVESQTPFTPPVSLIRGLMASLREITSEGMENLFIRHERLAAATRKGIEALGLEMFPDTPSNALTTVKIPDAERIGSSFVKYCEDNYGITFAGGQDSLKGKIFRIAHMGYYDELDIIAALGAVECALAEQGVMDITGRGVKAAMEVFTSAKL